MRYYTRQDSNNTVQGPFTVEALTDGIRAGLIPSNALASSDLGEDVADLSVWRSCDWFPLAMITELRGIVPPLPEATSAPRRVTVLTVVFYWVVAVCSLYSAITLRHWIMYITAVMSVSSGIEAIIRYVRQRQSQTAAA